MTKAVDEFEPFAHETLSDPHALWSALRDQAPVHQIELPGSSRTIFLVSRRTDVQAIAMDPVTYSSESPSDIWRWGDLGPDLQPRLLERGWGIVHTIASADPPRHTIYRKLFNRLFLPNCVRDLTPRLQAWTDELLDTLPRGETFDFMDAFAVPLPIGMIAGMLGLPMEDMPLIRLYTDTFVKLVDPSTRGEAAHEALETFAQGQHYLAHHIERCRAAPDDSIISAIANSCEDDGTGLSMEEKLSLGYLMLAAGNETTRNALALTAWHLTQAPSLFDRLKAEPDKVPAFVEESLRLGSPARLNPRHVMRDTELAGVLIPRDSVVFILWGSANRDEAAFESADEIRLDRPAPRNHQAFGYGLHSCIGAPLARQELQISVRGWLDRFDKWELAVPPGDIVSLPLFGFRTFAELPMKLS